MRASRSRSCGWPSATRTLVTLESRYGTARSSSRRVIRGSSCMSTRLGRCERRSRRRSTCRRAGPLALACSTSRETSNMQSTRSIARARRCGRATRCASSSCCEGCPRSDWTTCARRPCAAVCIRARAIARQSASITINRSNSIAASSTAIWSTRAAIGTTACNRWRTRKPPSSTTSYEKSACSRASASWISAADGVRSSCARRSDSERG